MPTHDRPTETGNWTPNNWKPFSQLPVICSVRNWLYSKLTALVQNNAALRIVSLGIGTGSVYPAFLPSHSDVQLSGIEANEQQLQECEAALKAQSVSVQIVRDMNVVFSQTLKNAQAILIHGDVTQTALPPRIDLVEATFVLHHILDSCLLRTMMKRVKAALVSGGCFLLGDVDLDVAEKIERKMTELTKQGMHVEIDAEKGEFFDRTTGKRLPILDAENPDDQRMLESVFRESAMRFFEEAWRYAPTAFASAAEVASQQRTMGVEFYRTAGQWQQLVSGSGKNNMRLCECLHKADLQNFLKSPQRVLDAPFCMEWLKG